MRFSLNKAQLIYVFFFWFFNSTELFADLTDDVEESAPVVSTPNNEATDQNIAPELPKIETPRPKIEKTQNKEPNFIKKNEKDSKKSNEKKASPGKIEKKNYKSADNSKQPVNFKSLGASGSKAKGIVELKKDVEIVQGDFKMSSNKAIVIMDKNEEVQEIVANGNVKIFKGDPDEDGVIKAVGDSMRYESKKQIVTIEGNARLWRGKDMMKGETIIYNIKTGWVTAEKVEGTVQPEDKNGI